MTCSTVVTVHPRVWVGCLACYDMGHLLGRWIDAEDADEITPKDLHGYPTSHKELWCFDHEGLPLRIGEMSPSTAQLWGDAFEEVGEERWPAFLAWVENSGYVKNSDGLPDPSSFEDRYQGCWPSFSEYLAEEIEVMQEGWPEDAIRYFDEDAYERDARFDYTVLDADDGNVYVFLDL